MAIVLRKRWDVPQLQNMALSPDGTHLATTHPQSKVVTLWEISGGTQVQEWSDSPCPVFALAFSPDGKHLAYAGANGCMIIRRLAPPTDRTFIQDGVFLVRSLAFSPDSRHLAGATVAEELPEESDVIVWGITRGKRVARLDKHPPCAHCLAFSPDGKLLAVGVHGGFKLWSVKKREPWQAASFYARQQPGRLTVKRPEGLPPIDAVTGAAFSPDGKSILLLVRKSELFRWEIDKERVVGHPCRKAEKSWLM